MKTKAFLNWSSGKDAMMALHSLHNSPEISIEKLVTTLNADFRRVSMHGVRAELLEQQALCLGLPLHSIQLGHQASLEHYNQCMLKHLKQLKAEGFTHSVFGDILLEDLKKYREEQLQKVAIQAIFPLWKRDTRQLVTELIELGYKARVVCVNAKLLDKSFCGRLIDKQFIDDLPKDVDPCGENGEFHSFVFDGPLFKQPVTFKLGETVARHYSPNESDQKDCYTKTRDWDIDFWFTDLLPLE